MNAVERSARLRHVRWIGGAPGGGKSTIARHIASRYGLRLYDTDKMMPAHVPRTTPESSPLLARFIEMDMDERWLNRSPETMLETFQWFRGEAFDLIVEDLLELPSSPGVVAEGLRLLPHLVHPLLTVPGQAVWLIPTPGMRRFAIQQRGDTWTIAGRTSDPHRALSNLAERDRLFAQRLAVEVDRLGLPVIEVDGTAGEDEVATRVAEMFGLGAAG